MLERLDEAEASVVAAGKQPCAIKAESHQGRVPSRPCAIKAECHRGPPMVRPEAPSSLLFTIAPENGRGLALGPASLGQSASGEALLLLLHDYWPAKLRLFAA